jgi:hypothetical protein
MKKFILAVTTFSWIGFGLAQIPTNGLVAAYNFNTGSTFLNDDSGNNYTLCSVGNPVMDLSNNSSHPAGDSAVYFNGGNRMYYCGGNGTNLLSNSVTISAWFKLSQFVPYNTIACVRYNDASAPYNALNLFTGTSVGGNIAFAFSTAFDADVIVEGTTVINYGQWYHAAATYDELTGVANIYLNGQLEGSVTVSASGIIYSNDALTIGNVPAGTPQDISNAFIGHIDEVLYYNRALSGEEVCEMYTGADCSPAVPAAPTNLTATVNGVEVSLLWNDNSTNETGYRLERSYDGVNYSLAANLGANTTAHYDYPGNGIIYYRVFALNANGDSDPSNVVVVTIGNIGLNEMSPGIHVFPNPANSVLNVEVQEATTAYVLSVSGNLLQTVELDTNLNTIDIGEFVSGIYFLKVGNSIVKFSKQ